MNKIKELRLQFKQLFEKIKFAEVEIDGKTYKYEVLELDGKIFCIIDGVDTEFSGKIVIEGQEITVENSVIKEIKPVEVPAEEKTAEEMAEEMIEEPALVSNWEEIDIRLTNLETSISEIGGILADILNKMNENTEMKTLETKMNSQLTELSTKIESFNFKKDENENKNVKQSFKDYLIEINKLKF
jgi:hypothetical protein